MAKVHETRDMGSEKSIELEKQAKEPYDVKNGDYVKFKGNDGVASHGKPIEKNKGESR